MSAERLNLLWGITMASGATAQLVAKLTSLQAVVLLLVSGLVAVSYTHLTLPTILLV